MINSVKSILEKLGYEVNAEDRHLAEFFNENGYCVIPKSDFLSENIDEYRRIIDSLLQKESWRVLYIFAKIRKIFFTEMIRRKVFWQPYHHSYFCYRHSYDDIDYVLNCINESLKAI